MTFLMKINFYLYKRYIDGKRKMTGIKNRILKSRMDLGRIRDYYPIGSPVMKEMALYNIIERRSMDLKLMFKKLPLLTSYRDSQRE